MTRKSGSNASLGVGAVVAMVVCCAGPLLVAAGALGVVGRLLDNPIVVVVGVSLAAAAVGGVLRHGPAAKSHAVPPLTPKAPLSRAGRASARRDSAVHDADSTENRR